MFPDKYLTLLFPTQRFADETLEALRAMPEPTGTMYRKVGVGRTRDAESDPAGEADVGTEVRAASISE